MLILYWSESGQIDNAYRRGTVFMDSVQGQSSGTQSRNTVQDIRFREHITYGTPGSWIHNS